MKLKENREVWINRIKDFKSSNLTKKEWCQKNDIKISTLRYWMINLDGGSNANLADTTPSTVEFASVSITPDYSSAVVLEVNNVRLSITNNYDEMFLLRLIKTLKKI